MRDPLRRTSEAGTPLRALIVEDEPLGYRRLLNLLGRETDIQVVGWARDADAALEAIRTHSPDVVFLDVELVGSSGLDVIRSTEAEDLPLFVFVTAHDQYAVEAFDLEAVDYLLKPYTDERVEDALQRVRRAAAAGAVEIRKAGSETSPQEGSASATRAGGRVPDPYLVRISVESRGKLRVVPVSSIDRIHAEGVYAELHAQGERFLVRESLTALETKLDPDRFCRIHRSDIVALEHVDSYSRAGGRYSVQLKSGKSLSVGRSYRKELERRLGCL
jgi:two-component system, LytTR family, response regulator